MPAKAKVALMGSEDNEDYKGIGTSVNSWDKTRYTPKIISQLEYERIKHEIPKGLKRLKYLSNYYKCLFDVIRYTGMRLSEALNLTYRDVDEGNQVLIIRQQKNGRVYDRQPIPKSLFKTLWDHFDQYHDYIVENDYYVFFSRHHSNNRITIQAANMFLHRLRERSDLAILNEVYGYADNGKPLHVFSFHTLRHLFITDVVNKLGLAEAKALARHDHLESTMRYLHTNVEMKKTYINQMQY